MQKTSRRETRPLPTRLTAMPNTFKDWAAADIPEVFFDTSEFADTLTINGTSVNVVWDKDSLEYKRIRDYDGMIDGDALFYISAVQWATIANVASPPRTDDAIQIAGQRGTRNATIVNVAENAGVYDITIRFTGYQGAI